ncbi:hypothetical protein D9M71_704210 [compost metagenome]
MVDDPGGVDDRIDAFEAGEEIVHRCVVGYVQFQVMNTLHALFRLTEAEGEHFMAVSEQALCSSQADARAAAGNDGSFFHGVFSWVGQWPVMRRIAQTETRPANRSDR